MSNRRSLIFFSFLLIAFIVPLQSGGLDSMAPDKNGTLQGSDTLYLKNNIHAQQGPSDCKASYANWTDPGDGHFIVPVNTPIRIGEFSGLGSKIKAARGILIVVLDENIPESRREIFFEFNSANMGGINSSEYVDLIASPAKVSLSGLSQIDRKGISEGKAYEGMTKDGVRMALGYPAIHKTPSLQENTWIYWRNRFRTMAVEFNQRGVVTLVRY